MKRFLFTLSILVCAAATCLAQTASGGSVPNATGTTAGKAKLGQLPTSTYAGLPTCNSGNDGQMYKVTDKNRDHYRCYGAGGNWVSTNGGVYNVQDFGAVGDGTADDAAAINLAVTAAAATSGKVVFPQRAGSASTVYKITTPIDLFNNVSYESTSGQSVQSGTTAVTISPRGAIYAFKRSTVASTVMGIHVKNITVDCYTDSASLGAFYLEGISYSSFENVGFFPSGSLTSRQYGFRVLGATYGAYQNHFTAFAGYISISGGAKATAFSFESAANGNVVIGGMVSGFDLPVIVDGTNGCQFIGFSADTGMIDAFRFQNSSNSNYVTGGRFESSEVAITSISRTANVATVTHPASNYYTGQLVRIFSVTGDTTFNAYAVPITVIDATHFTYASTGSNGSGTGGYYDIGNLVAFDATSTGNSVIYPAYIFGLGSLWTDASANKNLVIGGSAAATGASNSLTLTNSTPPTGSPSGGLSFILREAS